MSEWKEYKLGELCEVGRGSSPRPIIDQKYFVDGAIPWIKIADATASGKYIQSTKEHVNEYGASFSRYLDKNSLIIAASGVSLGQIKFLGVKGCIHDGWLYTSKYKEDSLDKDFLYYFLIYYSESFHSFSSGAAIQNINTEILRNTKVNLPPLQTQQKIANILSTYDELIEVNNERIKVLEETAQSLYKEWFVRFRFPNYQDTEFIKGVPKGWEVKEISELCEVTSSKRVFLEDYVEEGIVFYRGKEITLKSNNEPITDLLYISVKKFEDIKKRFGVPKIGDLLITAVGTTGNVHLVNEGDGEFYFKDGNLIWLRNVENDDLSTFLFSYLRTNEMMSRFDSIAIGSSQKALTISAIKKLKLLLPENKVLINFHEIVNPMFTQIQTLQQQNTELRQIRDRLLPRLISGKLIV